MILKWKMNKERKKTKKKKEKEENVQKGIK